MTYISERSADIHDKLCRFLNLGNTSEEETAGYTLVTVQLENEIYCNNLQFSLLIIEQHAQKQASSAN